MTFLAAAHTAAAAANNDDAVTTNIHKMRVTTWKAIWKYKVSK